MDTNTAPVDLASLAAPTAARTIHRIVDGFKSFQVLHAGFASGLFDWLDQHGPAEKSAISAATGLRGAHLGGFLQALEDLGLLARRHGAYSLAAELRPVLVSASPWCRAAEIEALLQPAHGWPDLRAFLSEGGAPPATPAAAPPPLALHPFLDEALRLAGTLTARWRQHGTAPHRLLCFDAGDGLAAAALCQALPELGATVVTAPAAVPATQATLEACGLAGRTAMQAGSPLDVPVSGSYDCVLLFHALYPVRKSTADALAATAARLAPGGELCAAHWFCLEACETAPGGLRDLDKAVLTDSHPLCHLEQFSQRLEQAGLADIERSDLPGEHGNTKLHFGRRPHNGEHA
ncbi:hypothetical protein E6C76_15410 [Pseudothauera nasutitermitis]|uniref:Uncharacterized protein n=1 Tax=Pseudothauera nasutitermitis TaxID=2565930 RepID=A0A4S4AVI6_9RHOO|nr:methyltransferase dimerization domain-containing protein [Pseudothauera nasutitermitis]THF63958.1 hypothetical protein E6C76_15410 [Pseudothauera nasutitermitis]